MYEPIQRSFTSKVNECLFYTKYISHVLMVFYSQSLSTGQIMELVLSFIIQNNHDVYKATKRVILISTLHIL